MLFTACHSYHQIFTSTFNIKQALQKHLMTGLLLRTTSQSRAIPAKIKSGLAVYRVAASPVSNPTGVGMQALLNDIRCGLIKGYLGILGICVDPPDKAEDALHLALQLLQHLILRVVWQTPPGGMGTGMDDMVQICTQSRPCAKDQMHCHHHAVVGECYG